MPVTWGFERENRILYQTVAGTVPYGRVFPVLRKKFEERIQDLYLELAERLADKGM